MKFSKEVQGELKELCYDANLCVRLSNGDIVMPTSLKFMKNGRTIGYIAGRGQLDLTGKLAWEFSKTQDYWL